MTASIYKGGRMAITKAMYDSVGSDYIELFYHKEKNAVGIKASTENNSDSFLLRKAKGQNTWMVGLKAFLNYYDVQNVEGKRFPAEKVDELIIIDLNKPLEYKKRGDQ